MYLILLDFKVKLSKIFFSIFKVNELDITGPE